MKFTKEEVSLAKQVAERWRKEIEYGDWFLNEGGFVKVWPYRHNCKRIDVIPLWAISDCLELLRENPRIQIVEIVWDIMKFKAYVLVRPLGTHKGETVLEACLKAVLAVLGDEK